MEASLLLCVLCCGIARNSFCLFSEDSAAAGKPGEKNKDRKAARPVRKVQKLTRLSSPESKQGDWLYSRGKTVACPSEMTFVSVFSDVQECCCSVFVCCFEDVCDLWLVVCACSDLSQCCAFPLAVCTLWELLKNVFFSGGGILKITVRLTQTKSSSGTVMDPAALLLIFALFHLPTQLF